MKVQNTIKRIVALGIVGGAMIGATAAAAVAYDLSNYPAPFVSNGVNQAKIVVGAAAKTEDMLGAIDIATSLQQAAVTPVESTGSNVVVAQGKNEEVAFGTTINASTAFGSQVDSTDVPFLKDGSVTIDTRGESNNYDYEEVIKLSNGTQGGVAPETGLSYAPDEEWKDRIFLIAPKGSMKYSFQFKENLKVKNYINDSSDDEPIEIDFLGRNLKITGATADSITVQVGTELNLFVGGTATVDGKEVKLINVGSGSTKTVQVSVDNQVKTITNSGTINGLRVTVNNVFYSDTTAERSATIIVGSESEKTYNNGDAFIGEDPDSYAWVWDLDGLDTATPTLGVRWEISVLGRDETESVAYPHVAYAGESYKFPNDFAEVKLIGANQNEYQTYEIRHSTNDLRDARGLDVAYNNVDVLKLTAPGTSNSGFIMPTSGEKTKEVYLTAFDNRTIGVFYLDSGSPARIVLDHNATINSTLEPTLFELDYKKSLVPVKTNAYFDGGNGADFSTEFQFNFGSQSGITDVLSFNQTTTSGAFAQVGIATDDTETGLKWNSDGITSWKENTMTPDGVIIKDPDTSYKKSSGYLSFQMPGDVREFKANVAIIGKGGQTGSTGGTGGVVQNPIAVGLAVLDTNANLNSGYNIVVGGPCVNTAAMTLMGNPTDCTAGFQEGKAIIKLFPDKNALLVAGYSAADTTGASRVLANYGQYMSDFTGNELQIITTNLNSLQVNPQP